MAKTIMRAFRLHEISAVDRPAQAHAKAAIMKREVPAEDQLTTESKMDKEVLKALGLPEEADAAAVVAAIAKKNEDIAKQAADLEIAKAGMTEDEAKLHDGLADDEAKKAFRALSREDRAKEIAKANEPAAEVKKAQAEVADLRKRLAAMEDERELGSFRKQAVELGLPEEDGAKLQKAYRGDKAAVDHLIGIIKAQGKQVAEGGLFKEFGSTRGDAVGAKAYDELKALAAEVQKANPSLTSAQAFEKVYTDRANAKLIEREVSERA